MAKNTNPLTKNLLIKQNWKTISLPITDRVKHGSNELIKDKFIKEVIDGSFKKLGVLTSEISITKNCIGENTIQFLYYPLSMNTTGGTSVSPDQRSGPSSPFGAKAELPMGAKLAPQPLGRESPITALIKIIKKILMIKEPTKNYKIVCVKAANKYVDGKILNDYISNMVIADPNKIKYVVNTLIKEYKLLNIKKYDTTINKGKYSR